MNDPHAQQEASQPSPSEQMRPFVIEHRRRGETPQGFIPEARLFVTEGLRTSGLLAALTDAEARTLLAVLTFLTPNGHVQPSAGDVAAALTVSERQARERLEQLTKSSWRGRTLLVHIPRAQSRDVWALTPSLVAHQEAIAAEQNPRQLSYPVAAGRAAVVAHSRAAYARPRAEVERMVAEQLGHAPEESADTPEGEARRRLLTLGVPRDAVEELLANHALEEIMQQLEWLPYRNAKSPARLIVAAIENRYEPPARVRLEQMIASEEATLTPPAPLDVPQETGETVSLAVPPPSSPPSLEVLEDANGE